MNEIGPLLNGPKLYVNEVEYDARVGDGFESRRIGYADAEDDVAAIQMLEVDTGLVIVAVK